MYCKENDEEYRKWRKHRTGEPVHKAVVNMGVFFKPGMESDDFGGWGELSIWPDGILFLSWPTWWVYVLDIIFSPLFAVPTLVAAVVFTAGKVPTLLVFFLLMLAYAFLPPVILASMDTLGQLFFGGWERKWARGKHSFFIPVDRLRGASQGVLPLPNGDHKAFRILGEDGDGEPIWTQAHPDRRLKNEWVAFFTDYAQDDLGLPDEVPTPLGGWKR